LSNKRISIPLWKNDIVVSLNSKNIRKVAKLAKDFDYTTTLTIVLKNKDKIFYHFFLTEHTRKQNTVSGNPNQRTLLTLAWLLP